MSVLKMNMSAWLGLQQTLTYTKRTANARRYRTTREKFVYDFLSNLAGSQNDRKTNKLE